MALALALMMRFSPTKITILVFLVGCANEDWFSLDDNNEVLVRRFWKNLFFSKFLKSLSSFLVNYCPWGHCKSISLILDGARKLVLALVSMVLSTTSSQESRSLFRTSSWAWIKGRRLSQKYLIMVSLLGAATESNSWRIVCKCSRFAAQSGMFSCWY